MKTLQQIKDTLNLAILEQFPKMKVYKGFVGGVIAGLSQFLFLQTRRINALESSYIGEYKGVGDELDLQISNLPITRKKASKSSGVCIVQGVLNTLLPSEEFLQGGAYIQTNANTILLNNILHAGGNYNNATITINTPTNQLPIGTVITLEITGLPVAVSGDFAITESSENAISFEVTGLTGSGNIDISQINFIDFIGAYINIVSDIEGLIQNVEPNTLLAFDNENLGVNTVKTSVQGITGGTDLESDASLKSRALQYIQNPSGYFAPSYIESTLLQELPEVTRVFVQRATPDTGSATVYCVFENRTNILPTPTDLAQINQILSKIAPADLNPDTDIITNGLNLINTQIEFINFVPTSVNMKNAILQQIKIYFKTQIEPASTLSIERLTGYLLANTLDDNGNRLTQIEITAPSSDITSNKNELITHA